MANEWIPRYAESSQGGYVIQDYDVDDNTGLEKGRLLVLLDSRKVSGATTDNAVCAGVLAREKISGDGRTRVPVYKKGYFDVNFGAAATLGYPVSSFCSTSGANIVHQATAALSGAAILGYVEETASAGEVAIVRLDL